MLCACASAVCARVRREVIVCACVSMVCVCVRCDVCDVCMCERCVCALCVCEVCEVSVACTRVSGGRVTCACACAVRVRGGNDRCFGDPSACPQELSRRLAGQGVAPVSAEGRVALTRLRCTRGFWSDLYENSLKHLLAVETNFQ